MNVLCKLKQDQDKTRKKQQQIEKIDNWITQIELRFKYYP